MLGITFTIHGAQKAIGGFHEPMTMMSNMGFPAFVGILLGLFELVGGIMMIVGLLTNYIAIGFIVIMLGALCTVHGSLTARLYGFRTPSFIISYEYSYSR